MSLTKEKKVDSKEEEFMAKIRNNRKANISVNNKDDIKLMKDLLSIQSKSKSEDDMVMFITDFIDKIDGCDYSIDKENNILVVKGTLDKDKDEYYPCFVAHTDEVHDERKDYRIYEQNDEDDGNLILFGAAITQPHKYTTWNKGVMVKHSGKEELKQCGIGADDKAGIFIALRMLEKLDIAKAFFPTQEEIGTIGAKAVDMDFFKDVGYLLEGDKHGQFLVVNKYSGDDIFSPSFEAILKGVMKEFTWEYTNGFSTDVMTLSKNKVNRSVINYSVGYYNHHTDKEVLDMNELLEALDFIEELTSSLGNELYEFDFNKSNKSYNHNSNIGFNRFNYNNFYEDEYNYYNDRFQNAGSTYGSKKDDEPKEAKLLCECVEEHGTLELIEAGCDQHDAILTNGEIKTCPNCGTAIFEREKSFVCDECELVLIKNY